MVFSNPSELQPECPNMQLLLGVSAARVFQAAMTGNSMALRKLIQTVGAEPSINVEVAYSMTKNYLLGFAPVAGPCIIIALLAVLAWLPLYISRMRSGLLERARHHRHARFLSR